MHWHFVTQFPFVFLRSFYPPLALLPGEMPAAVQHNGGAVGGGLGRNPMPIILVLLFYCFRLSAHICWIKAGRLLHGLWDPMEMMNGELKCRNAVVNQMVFVHIIYQNQKDGWKCRWRKGGREREQQQVNPSERISCLSSVCLWNARG